MTDYITKEHFDARLEGFQSGIRQEIRDLVKEMRQGFTDVDKRLGKVDERLSTLESKSDAIMELVATRQEVRNLTRELRNHGIQIIDHKVFEK